MLTNSSKKDWLLGEVSLGLAASCLLALEISIEIAALWGRISWDGHFHCLVRGRRGTEERGKRKDTLHTTQSEGKLSYREVK